MINYKKRYALYYFPKVGDIHRKAQDMIAEGERIDNVNLYVYDKTKGIFDKYSSFKEAYPSSFSMLRRDDDGSATYSLIHKIDQDCFLDVDDVIAITNPGEGLYYAVLRFENSISFEENVRLKLVIMDSDFSMLKAYFENKPLQDLHLFYYPDISTVLNVVSNHDSYHDSQLYITSLTIKGDTVYNTVEEFLEDFPRFRLFDYNKGETPDYYNTGYPFLSNYIEVTDVNMALTHILSSGHVDTGDLEVLRDFAVYKEGLV